MAILPPGIPGRLPVVPFSSTVNPATPVETIRPVEDPPRQAGPAPRTAAARLAPAFNPRGDAGQPVAPAAPAVATLPLETVAMAPLTQGPVDGLPENTPATPRPALLPPLPPIPEGEGARSAPFAAALRQAVEKSGVFYESHLVDWVTGTRTLEELREEAGFRAVAAEMAARASQPDPIREQQVDILRQGLVGWVLPSDGDPHATLWVAEEAPEAWYEPASSARVRLDLDLPGRGRVEVTLRVHDGELQAELDPGEGGALTDDEVAALGRRLSAVPGVRFTKLARKARGNP